MPGYLTDGVAQGPLPFTGAETTNMDTNLTQGQNPASGSYTSGQMASGPSQAVTIVTGGTVTIPGTVVTEAIFAAGSLAAANVVLTPQYDGQVQKFSLQQIATALTVTSNTLTAPITLSNGTVLAAGYAPTVVGGPTTSAAVGGHFAFIFKNGYWLPT